MQENGSPSKNQNKSQLGQVQVVVLIVEKDVFQAKKLHLFMFGPHLASAIYEKLFIFLLDQ